MSDFGPPPGPSGAAGTPPTAAGGADAATNGKPGAAQQATMLTYAAAALGVLSFVWGFLDWLSSGSGSSSAVSGYESVGSAVVGLLLAAGLLAGVSALEDQALTLAPAAVSVAGLLVAFAELVNHGDGLDAGIGLILVFITAIVQATALIVAWLLATERPGE